MFACLRLPRGGLASMLPEWTRALRVLATPAQRHCDSCADALRTKNPVCWQVLTFRGRQGERPVRCRAACFAFRLLIALVCRIVRSRAFVLLLSTTSNRQNLPATGVFRARSPYAEQADGRQGSRGAADRAGSGRRRPLAQGRAGAGAPGGAHPLPHGRTRKHRASRASGRFAPTPQSKNQQRYARGLRGAGARNASTHRTKSAGASRCTLCPEP